MDEEEATELTETTKGDGGNANTATTANTTKTTTTKGNEEKNKEDEALKSASNIDSPSDMASTDILSSGNAEVLDEDLTTWGRYKKFIRLEIVQTSWFETVILIVIIINCVFLALDNPTNSDQTLQEFSYPSNTT